MNSPLSLWLKACAFIAVLAIAGVSLDSCAVSPDGPAMAGASHGALGSSNMTDYYYKKQAGWTYTFSNVEKVYNSDGTVANTYTGSQDYVTTMGFDGFAPNGDSLFRYQITYRVLSAYAGMDSMNLNYVSATGDDDSHGAWVEPGYSVSGMTGLTKRPRPVSTDTILAGVAGRVRTEADDFTYTGTDYVWQTDTLWTTQHLDSTYIWEHPGPGQTIVPERCIFIRNFIKNNTWTYDVINNPSPTTSCVVANADQSLTVGGVTYPHVVDIRIKTSECDDKGFNREYKYYSCYTGIVEQYDWWYATTDGVHFTKKDFTRSLISLSHN